jgi:hypothetical protein
VEAQLWWLTEAPVGIEPTNGGFAVLRGVLAGFIPLPKLFRRRPLGRWAIQERSRIPREPAAKDVGYEIKALELVGQISARNA